MNTPVAIAVGVTLGLRHATDADHVVALSTMVQRQSGLRGALILGAAWGVGHTLVLLAAGVPIVVLGIEMPPAFDRVADAAVAAMLIVLGLHHLLRGNRARSRRSSSAPVRPFLVGMVHGLAGSAGIALLALTTIGARTTAMLYLMLFGLGSVVGMMALTSLLALPLRYAGRRGRFEPWLVRAASVVSLGFGLALAVRCSFSP